MLIKEFRIVLPLTIQEYQVAQLYSVAEASKNETGGGEGVEVLVNEPYEGEPLFNNQYNTGQYTHKIYHIEQKLPNYLRLLAPKSVFTFHEIAWNAYPYCRTVITNPDYMKDNFEVKIETLHLPDRGTSENAHNLPKDVYKKVQIVNIDIADDSSLPKADRKAETDPAKFHSTKTGRGPLIGDWKATVEPAMCCYKLVSCNFKWFGLQTKVENFLMDIEKRLFTKFHRELFCWIDRWHGLSMKDIRSLEERTKAELDNKRLKCGLSGTTDLE
ncbi:unnamed protein product [Gordionus sp. m RMFG-2023]|uniref:phosphatidylinositol transfer protein beta isoform-like n=1 Tax=Gordionus sp. m RMFG-2023 TaxID=3053472 RepID=UPI0030E1B004